MNIAGAFLPRRGRKEKRMYLHLGNDAIVRKTEIVGIFDLDNTTQSVRTREFLARAEKEKTVVNAAGAELPKSFVLCGGDGERKIFLSQLNSSTLQKRSESLGIE